MGTLPVSDLAPLEYRYAIDAATVLLDPTVMPLVCCHVPQLAAEVRQRIPRWAETDLAASGLWLEPLKESWEGDLLSLREGLQPGASLVVIASRPFARLLPERHDWTGQPLGQSPGGLTRLRQALDRAGFHVKTQYGIHSISAMSFNMLARASTRLGRPDLGDRLHVEARLRYCASSHLKEFSAVALLFGWRTS